jgi:two-component system, sensor histidine kinase and response regulator
MSKLLVIDDEPSFREVLADTLREAGYEVEEASDGAKGVIRAREVRPDLILCDIMMSGLDGYDVLAALRQDPWSALIPVIFLTGVDHNVGLRKGMELGADDYLVKPVRAEELVRAIEARLARHGDVRQEVQRRLDRLRSDLAQSLPHEFLTPLTAVMGLSSLLVEDDGSLDAGTLKEVAAGIFVGSRKLQQIIAKFIFYAELEAYTRKRAAGDESAELLAEQAGPLVAQVAQMKADQMARAQDLTVTTQDVRVPMVRDHLRQLVEELVENALTFSTPGSAVSLDLAASSRDAGSILTVRDAGRGMTAEQVRGLEHYAPLRRHQEQPGLGLGLAIVRRVAENHGGRVEIETRPEQGTTVRVHLP